MLLLLLLLSLRLLFRGFVNSSVEKKMTNTNRTKNRYIDKLCTEIKFQRYKLGMVFDCGKGAS